MKVIWILTAVPPKRPTVIDQGIVRILPYPGAPFQSGPEAAIGTRFKKQGFLRFAADSAKNRQEKISHSIVLHENSLLAGTGNSCRRNRDFKFPVPLRNREFPHRSFAAGIPARRDGGNRARSGSCIAFFSRPAPFSRSPAPRGRIFPPASRGCAADAARGRHSPATLDKAFGGLQPDMKVLEFQKQQPEFKTPIWDYVAGLVDERAGFRRQGGDGEGGARARPRRADFWGQPVHGRRDLGSGVQFRDGRWASGPWSVALHPRLHGRAAELFPLGVDGDAQDHRQGRHPGREAFGLVGGRLRPDPVHALELSEARGRRDRRAARHRRTRPTTALASTAHYFAKSGWRSGVPWGFEVKLPPGHSGPSGRKAKQPMSAWAARGITRDRRAPARRGRGGAAPARGPGRPGLPGDAQFRRRLFLQRRQVPIRSRPACSPTGWRAARASSPPGRPTIRVSRARDAASCRPCSPSAATTSARPTGRSARRPRRRSPIFEQKNGMAVNGRASQKVLEALRR